MSMAYSAAVRARRRRVALPLAAATAVALGACSREPELAIPADLIALIDRAAIEDLLVDYYSQIGSDNYDYSIYFTVDGTLDVNGLVARGKTEIEALYARAGGGAGEAPSQSENAVPPGRFHMLLSNLKVDVQGNTAVATLLWHSIVSATLTSPPSVTEHGRERTDLVKDNGRWLISNRVVTSDGGMPEGLLPSYVQR
jgi:hypothetical protein